MKLLLIGYGSIGARHARIATELGAHVACVSKNDLCPYPVFSSIEQACQDWQPDRVLIANPTALHENAIKTLDEVGYTNLILVEKPIFSQPPLHPPKYPEQIFVAYNLRFHPLVKRLAKRLTDLDLYSAEFHVGQYLPSWRPDRDYRLSYSSYKNQGGGVLRDLSHEIDLALLLCGDFHQVVAVGGHFSDLEISSDDVFMGLAKTTRCNAVSISLNYLNQTPQRLIRINAKNFTANLDLVKGSLMMNHDFLEMTPERDAMYRSQLESFFAGNVTDLCNYRNGVEVLKFIHACEASIQHPSWQTIHD